jgi:hypothetical protein
MNNIAISGFIVRNPYYWQELIEAALNPKSWPSVLPGGHDSRDERILPLFQRVRFWIPGLVHHQNDCNFSDLLAHNLRR